MHDGYESAIRTCISQCASVADYVHRIESAWTDINTGHHRWSKESERHKYWFLLIGLDSPSWKDWKTKFLADAEQKGKQKPFCFRKIARELQLAEEKKPSTAKVFTTNAVDETQKTLRECAHCGKEGHIVDQCWKKHPHLPPRRPQGSGRNQGWNRGRGAGTDRNKPRDETPKAEATGPAIALLTETVKAPVTTLSTGTLHWIIDTACDEHIVSSANYFVPGTTRTTPRTVRTALTTQSAECIIGDIDIVLRSTHKAGTPARLYDVLYVPGLQYNLISGTKLADRGIEAVFKRQGLELIHNDQLLTTGARSGHNWLLNVQEIVQRPMTVLNTSVTAEDTVVNEGSDFSLYHNPDLPPINTSTTTTTEHATPAPTTNTTAYKGQGVAQMGSEDDKEGIIIIDDDDEHGTSDSEGSIAPEAESYGLEAEEYDSPSERAPQVLISTTITTTSRDTRRRIDTLALSTSVTQSKPSEAAEGLPDLPALLDVEERWLESPRSLAEAQASPLWP
jgi:hypothetical protein